MGTCRGGEDAVGEDVEGRGGTGVEGRPPPGPGFGGQEEEEVEKGTLGCCEEVEEQDGRGESVEIGTGDEEGEFDEEDAEGREAGDETEEDGFRRARVIAREPCVPGYGCVGGVGRGGNRTWCGGCSCRMGIRCATAAEN